MKVKRFGPGPYKKIYLVAPRHPESFWSLQGTVQLLGARTLMPNSALATLMSLTPPDVSVEYFLCDENISDLDLEQECDLVAVTGATLHAARVEEICRAFRARGIRVALGGTFASTDPDRCREFVDHLFVGEAEYTWPEFLQEWTYGGLKAVYRQKDHIDMADSPAPDWSLIRASDYVNISVQTARGCPNRCDFCDVIQYVGRVPRVKSVEQVMTEIKNAHELGARSVFFSDDNFLADRKFTRDLLGSLIEWNSGQAHPLSFSTQITVQVADDDELLKMFADARFSVLFLGVETVRKASLREAHKQHNLSRDIRERITAISRYGIVPFLGLIVGFDNDDETVFDELYAFIDETASPIAGISLLNAPLKTPLYQRLKREGRLAPEGFGGEWQLRTNIIPKKMSREILVERYRGLFERIYSPASFEDRMARWLRMVEYFTPVYTNKKGDMKVVIQACRMFAYFIFSAPSPQRGMFFRNLKRTWLYDKRLIKRSFTLLAQYRHFYEFVKKMKRADR